MSESYDNFYSLIYNVSSGVPTNKTFETKHYFSGKSLLEWMHSNETRVRKYFTAEIEYADIVESLVERGLLKMVGRNVESKKKGDELDLDSDWNEEMIAKAEFFYERKRKIVIIGGGWAGRKLARKLDGMVSDVLDVVLINDTPYFESKTALPFVMVDVTKIETFRKPLTNYMKKVTIVVDVVKKIANNGDIVMNNHKILGIDYDILVFATGSDYNLGLLNPEKATIPVLKGLDMQPVLDHMKDIENAKDIAVIGGGPVGIEIIGELMMKYPDKKFSFICGRQTFMERSGIKGAHEACAKILSKAKNVNCLMSRHVARIENDRLWMAENPQESVRADVVFACLGFIPRAPYLMEYQGGKLLNRFGQIKVNEYLQVENHPSWFVIGDVSDVKEEKLAGNAERTAMNVYNNIKRILNRNPSLEPYKVEKGFMLISVGPKASLMVKNDKVLMNNFIVRAMKGFLEGYFMK